jgi:hypothetical protein
MDVNHMTSPEEPVQRTDTGRKLLAKILLVVILNGTSLDLDPAVTVMRFHDIPWDFQTEIVGVSLQIQNRCNAEVPLETVDVRRGSRTGAKVQMR